MKTEESDHEMNCSEEGSDYETDCSEEGSDYERVYREEKMAEVIRRRNEVADQMMKEAIERGEEFSVCDVISPDCKMDFAPCMGYILIVDSVTTLRVSLAFRDTLTVKGLIERMESLLNFRGRCDIPYEWGIRSLVDLEKTHTLIHNNKTDLLKHPTFTLSDLGVKSGDKLIIRHKSAHIPFNIKIKIKGGPGIQEDDRFIDIELLPEYTPLDAIAKIKREAGINPREKRRLCIVSTGFHYPMIDDATIEAYGFRKRPQQEEEDKIHPNGHKMYLCTENEMYLCPNDSLHARMIEIPSKFTSNPHVSELIGKMQPSEEKKALGILLPTAVQSKPQVGEVATVGKERDIGKNIVQFIPKNEMFSTSPTDEKIKNKSHLEEYLCANSRSPSLSEFDWGSEDEKPKKRKKDAEEERESEESKADIPEAEVNTSTVEDRVSTDVEVKEVDNVVDKNKVGKGEAEQDSVGRSKGDVEEETVEPEVKKDVPEAANIQDASVLITCKEDKKAEQEEEKTNKEEDKSEKETQKNKVVLHPLFVRELRRTKSCSIIRRSGLFEL